MASLFKKSHCYSAVVVTSLLTGSIQLTIFFPRSMPSFLYLEKVTVYCL